MRIPVTPIHRVALTGAIALLLGCAGAPRASGSPSSTSSGSSVTLVEIHTHADATMELHGPGGALSLRRGDDMVVWTRRPVPESRLRDAEVVFAG